VIKKFKEYIKESDQIRKDPNLRFDYLTTQCGPNVPPPKFDIDDEDEEFDEVEYKGKIGKREEDEKKRKPQKTIYKMDQDEWKHYMSPQKGQGWAGPGKAFGVGG
jgi:hypothetical protein